MDYAKIAKKIEIFRKVSIEDDELDSLNLPGSDLYMVLVDEYSIPIEREWFDSIVKRFEQDLAFDKPFQIWDVNILNSWKVSPRLLQAFHTNASAEDQNTPLYQAIAKHM
jgi:hypothetical protein